MPTTAIKNELGLILSDFVKMFFIHSSKERPISSFDTTKRLKEIVDELNDGLCFVVASHCGYVLRQRHPAGDIKIVTNKYHCWIELEGEPFDTLFPDGYPASVNEMWYPDCPDHWDLSPLIQEVGEEPNKGRWDWVLIYTFKSLCKTWNVEYPGYMKGYEAGARQTNIQCFPSEEGGEEKNIPLITSSWPKSTYVLRTFQLPKTHPNYKAPGEK